MPHHKTHSHIEIKNSICKIEEIFVLSHNTFQERLDTLLTFLLCNVVSRISIKTELNTGKDL